MMSVSKQASNSDSQDTSNSVMQELEVRLRSAESHTKCRLEDSQKDKKPRTIEVSRSTIKHSNSQPALQMQHPQLLPCELGVP